MGQARVWHGSNGEGRPMKTAFRESRGGKSTLRKVASMIARGWRPGMTVRETLSRRRRRAAGRLHE